MFVQTLPELLELESLITHWRSHIEVRKMCEVQCRKQSLPVYAIVMGSRDPDAPAVGFFGGVHGLERIGTQVLLSFLRMLLTRLSWDRLLQQQFQHLRLVFMPLVNPGGMLQATRCNPRGIDLMRNAPVDAKEKVPFLIGGQRISQRLPWYRGQANSPMEAENQAVCAIVEEELLSRPFSIALDCHSGFGLRDRIWFPLAHTLTPIQNLPDICALENLFSQTYPNHPYVFEPQSLQYRTHGDLWDHIYLNATAGSERTFLPLTLEMGSWMWVKKNPSQLFSRHGIFNPKPPHRLQRVLRSHLVWFDFLTRAASAHKNWLPNGGERDKYFLHAFSRWYANTPP